MKRLSFRRKVTFAKHMKSKEKVPFAYFLLWFFQRLNRFPKPAKKVHPYFQQSELLELCRQKNLQIQAFSPFAHGELGLLDDRLLLLGLVGEPMVSME